MRNNWSMSVKQKKVWTSLLIHRKINLLWMLQMKRLKSQLHCKSKLNLSQALSSTLYRMRFNRLKSLKSREINHRPIHKRVGLTKKDKFRNQFKKQAHKAWNAKRKLLSKKAKSLCINRAHPWDSPLEASATSKTKECVRSSKSSKKCQRQRF